MKIIEPSVEFLNLPQRTEVLTHIERCGRVCYKSEELMTEGSSIVFVQKIIKSGHEAVIEHFNITAKFICDRGVTHELVRHRLASYCQESTRYCNYSQEKFGKEITVIAPHWYTDDTANNPKARALRPTWIRAMEAAEQAYLMMLEDGATPQEARAVLPNSLKTEIVMTANLREWRHIIKLRTSKRAHPDMRYVMILAYDQLVKRLPEIFSDIVVEL